MTFDDCYFETYYGNYGRQNPSRKLAWYADLIEPWLPAGPIRHHDLGCGLGHFASHAVTRGWSVHGSDISEHGVRVARERCPTADIRVADAYSQPWGPGVFQVVTALDVIEHVPDVDRALTGVADSLVPGGIALFVVPVYDGLSGPIIRRLDRDPTHLHKWGRDRWLEAIPRPLTIEHWTGIFRFLIPAGPYLHAPTMRFRRHAPAIAVVTRRDAV